MPRTKRIPRTNYNLGTVASLKSDPAEVSETGTVRMSAILDALDRVLEPYPEIRSLVSDALTSGLGADPSTRIQP